MRLAFRLIAAFAIAFMIPAVASAGELDCIEANATFNAQKIALKGTNTTTSATSVVNVTDAVVANLAVANDSCFIVTYTGQFKAPKGARLSVVVSGVMSPPTGYPLTEDIVTTGTGFDSRTVSFMVRHAPSCSCTVQLKIQSLVSGQSVTAGRGLLRVEYYNGV